MTFLKFCTFFRTTGCPPLKMNPENNKEHLERLDQSFWHSILWLSLAKTTLVFFRHLKEHQRRSLYFSPLNEGLKSFKEFCLTPWHPTTSINNFKKDLPHFPLNESFEKTSPKFRKILLNPLTSKNNFIKDLFQKSFNEFCKNSA